MTIADMKIFYALSHSRTCVCVCPTTFESCIMQMMRVLNCVKLAEKTFKLTLTLPNSFRHFKKHPRPIQTVLVRILSLQTNKQILEPMYIINSQFVVLMVDLY